MSILTLNRLFIVLVTCIICIYIYLNIITNNKPNQNYYNRISESNTVNFLRSKKEIFVDEGNDVYTIKESWESVIKPPLYHGQIIPNPDDLKREKKLKELQKSKEKEIQKKTENENDKNKQAGLIESDNSDNSDNDNIDRSILNKYMSMNEINALISMENDVQTYITIMKNNNSEYTKDYWDFPLQYQTLYDKDINDITAKHICFYELYIARKKWFYEDYYSKKKLLQNERNKYMIDDNNNMCQLYKNTNEMSWKPKKDIDVCNFETTSIFFHSMHGTMAGKHFRDSKDNKKHFMWEFSSELIDCQCPSNVAFVFADNRHNDNETRLVQNSYIKCNNNCKYFHISKDYNPWDWFGKIGPLLNLINDEAFYNMYEYVVLTDADDQTLIKSPINIINEFEYYECDLLIAGEATSYPHWLRKEKSFENSVYPWSRHHQHLNAGGFMGKIKNIIPYLKYMKSDYDNYTRNNPEEIKERGNRWRDQTCFRQMHRKFYPSIKIDSFSKIWSRVDIFMYDI